MAGQSRSRPHPSTPVQYPSLPLRWMLDHPRTSTAQCLIHGERLGTDSVLTFTPSAVCARMALTKREAHAAGETGHRPTHVAGFRSSQLNVAEGAALLRTRALSTGRHHRGSLRQVRSKQDHAGDAVNAARGDLSSLAAGNDVYR